MYDWLGFILIFIVGFFLISGPLQHSFPRMVRSVVLAGFLMRPVGSFLRQFVLYYFYDGGDAGKYYRAAVYYAQYLWDFDLASFLSRTPSSGNFGTQFVMWFSGAVVALIGPTKRGGFLFFSILSFFGLLFFLKSFQNNYPKANLKGYAMLLLFWPSLWFWPSSMGKDALILLATGMVVYGYCGKNIRWFALILGLLLAGAIRPHVVGVMVLALSAAHLLLPGRRWTAKHVLQGVMLLALSFFVLSSAASQLGVETDLESISTFTDEIRDRTSSGGSQIAAPGFSLTSAPIAVINMLCRPFPWEAGSLVTGAAAAEIMVLWYMVFRRRRRILQLAKEWRQHKVLRIALPLTILYVFMLGMAFGNLGIIARQRIHIFPLLFLWFEAIPLRQQAPQPAPSPKRRLVPAHLRA